MGDSYLHKIDRAAPAGWKFGDNCFVAISTNTFVDGRRDATFCGFRKRGYDFFDNALPVVASRIQ